MFNFDLFWKSPKEDLQSKRVPLPLGSCHASFLINLSYKISNNMRMSLNMLLILVRQAEQKYIYDIFVSNPKNPNNHKIRNIMFQYKVYFYVKVFPQKTIIKCIDKKKIGNHVYDVCHMPFNETKKGAKINIIYKSYLLKLCMQTHFRLHSYDQI